MLVMRVRLLVATLWVGSLWSVSWLVAPTLFATLSDKALAGTIAGSLFQVQAWVSVFCGILLIALISLCATDNDSKQRQSRLMLTGAMLACTVIGYFGLQPFMAELRASVGPGAIMAPNVRVQFAVLHAISGGLYFIQSLLGVVLILKIR
jgi:hypothetical protein